MYSNKMLFSIAGIICTNCMYAQTDNTLRKDSISEVVISENRFQIPFAERNKNIEIITAQDISQMPVKSISEVLAFINGVDVRQRGPFGTQADISIDGGTFEQALILLNGVKISDPQTGHHTMNIPVALDAIERIEVLRGPMARVYGVNALTGAINIVTKSFAKNSLTVHLQGGSSLENKEEGDGSGKYWGGGAQVVAQLGNKDFQNLISLSTNKTNGQRYNSATEDMRLYYQGAYNLNASNSLDWSAGYIDNEFGANGYYAAPGDKESYEIVRTAFAHFSTKHYFGEKFYISPRISNRYNSDDYRYYRNDLSKARSEHKNNALSLELNSRLTTSLGQFGLGLELRDEDVKSNNLGNHTRENFGSYLEYRTELLSKLTLHVGAYSNYNSKYGWEVYPGVDVGYQFIPKWKLNLNVGKSQRIPSFTDLYLKQPANVGNPDLKSEYAWQYETSLQGKIGGTQLEIRYFYRDINDFVDWTKNAGNVTDPTEISKIPYQPLNLGNNKMHGVSASLSRVYVIGFDRSLKYVLGYNYLSPEDLSYQTGIISKYVLESLKHQALLRILYNARNWEFSTGNRWIKRELNKPYFVSDVRLGYTIHHWNIYGDVTNIANASYQESGAVLMPKRWFSFGIRLSL
ncbi:TonB-dependent receptor plug domain-containing protein [Sphingobacterium sp. SGL-16]|uniref:TonB-dependent receptor plug domain-containing protein n=1 Tax=Sphingobacterium sp. SGL-16 TaxID=2710883 RepID=UPI0013EA7501|nr:TonB-dependent receptor [Sphingobacterium sp. SGL-16]NGM74308.1 TonB-dependent receptor [Sphingobacterium sp. SGL-16]